MKQNRKTLILRGITTAVIFLLLVVSLFMYRNIVDSENEGKREATEAYPTEIDKDKIVAEGCIGDNPVEPVSGSAIALNDEIAYPTCNNHEWELADTVNIESSGYTTYFYTCKNCHRVWYICVGG